MFKWRNVKLAKKLGLAFGIVLFLTISSGIFSMWEAKDVGNHFSYVTDDQLAALLDSSDTLIKGNDVYYAIRGYKYTETPEMLKQAKDSLNNLKSSLKATEVLMNKYPRLQVVTKYYPMISENINRLSSNIEKAFELAAQKEEYRKKVLALGEIVFGNVDSFFKNRIDASLQIIDKIDQVNSSRELVNKEDIETAKRRVGQHILRTQILSESMNKVNDIVNFAMNDKFSPKVEVSLKKEVDNTLPMFENLKAVSLLASTKDMIEKIEASLNEWLEYVNKYVAIRDKLMDYFDEVDKTQNELKDTLTKYDESVIAEMKEVSAESMSDLLSMQNVILFGMIFSVVLGIIISFLTARSVSRPINRIVGIAKRIGDGDFSVKHEEFGYEGKDEIGTLVDAFDGMIKEQCVVMNEILDTSKEIANESLNLAALSEETNASMEEIRASVDQITSLSVNNSSALEQSNAGIEEMSAGAATVAQSSTNGAQNASSTSEVTENAVKVVEDVILQINKVGDMSNENEKEIRDLVSSVEQITSFVSIITNIADQTNLLALNAAIEAARAGEAGRGFAVVADEVRKLAEESGHAAKNIKEKILGLQSSAQQAIGGTVKSAEIVREVLTKAEKAQAGLDDGVKRMKVINDEIQNIAAIAQEQAAASKEMAGSIDVVTRGTVEVEQRITGVHNSAAEASKASEGVALAAQSLSNHAARMTEVLSHFRVAETSNKNKNKLAIATRNR